MTLFLSDFYRNKRAELTEIISPSFHYQSPFFGNVDFHGYLHWMEQFSSIRSVVKKSQPQTNDNVIFTHEFSLKVLDYMENFEEEMMGHTTITIKDGLIENVINLYDEEISNPQKFEKIKAKLIT